MISVKAALQDLLDRQQWAIENRAEVPGISEAIEALAQAMTQNWPEAEALLSTSSDAEFECAAQAFERTARRLGLRFVEEVERLSALRPMADVTEELAAARGVL